MKILMAALVLILTAFFDGNSAEANYRRLDCSAQAKSIAKQRYNQSVTDSVARSAAIINAFTSPYGSVFAVTVHGTNQGSYTFQITLNNRCQPTN